MANRRTNSLRALAAHGLDFLLPHRLVRQAGGFEGLIPVEVLECPGDLAVAHGEPVRWTRHVDSPGETDKREHASSFGAWTFVRDQTTPQPERRSLARYQNVDSASQEIAVFPRRVHRSPRFLTEISGSGKKITKERG